MNKQEKREQGLFKFQIEGRKRLPDTQQKYEVNLAKYGITKAVVRPPQEDCPYCAIPRAYGQLVWCRCMGGL